MIHLLFEAFVVMALIVESNLPYKTQTLPTVTNSSDARNITVDELNKNQCSQVI